MWIPSGAGRCPVARWLRDVAPRVRLWLRPKVVVQWRKDPHLSVEPDPMIERKGNPSLHERDPVPLGKEPGSKGKSQKGRDRAGTRN